MAKIDNETKEEARIRVAEWRRRKGIAARKPAVDDPVVSRDDELEDPDGNLKADRVADDLKDALKDLETALDDVRAKTGDFVAGGGSPTKQARPKRQPKAKLGEGEFERPWDAPAFLKAGDIEPEQAEAYARATGPEDDAAQRLSPQLLSGTMKSLNAVIKRLGFPVSTGGTWRTTEGFSARRDASYRSKGRSTPFVRQYAGETTDAYNA